MAGSERTGRRARRAAQERPSMVRLSDFGKPPPPPPRLPINKTRLAIQIAIIVIVLAAFIILAIQLQGRATIFWRGATCLDVRRGC